MSRVAIGVVFVAIATMVLGFVALSGRLGAPSAAECVDDWNGRAGRLQRDQAGSGEFRSAIARGWLAKRTYPGCGITFITRRGEPWLSCVRTFHAAVARLTEWSCEGGKHLGRGRSRGIDLRPNATVGSDSKLVLNASVSA